MAFCSKCGTENTGSFCSKCGNAVNGSVATPAPTNSSNASFQNQNSQSTSSKSWMTTMVMTTLLGYVGGHRFYAGKIGSGIAQLFTFGGLGLWTFIDWIMLLSQSFTDSNGQKIMRKENDLKKYFGFYGVMIVLCFVAAIALAGMSDSSTTTTPTASAEETSMETTDSVATVTEEQAIPETIDISAATLLDEFLNNEVRARDSYIDKKVKIDGTISLIGFPGDGSVAVILNGSDVMSRNGVQCNFRSAEGREKVKSLNQGDHVIIIGDCSDFDFVDENNEVKNVQLMDCQFAM